MDHSSDLHVSKKAVSNPAESSRKQLNKIVSAVLIAHIVLIQRKPIG